MLLQRALFGLPTSLLLLVLAQVVDAHEQQQQQQQQQAIPLAIRKMGLDEGEKFYPEEYYGFDNIDNGEVIYGDARGRKTEGSGRSLAALFSFGRRSPSIATSPDTVQERQAGSRWPAAVRRTVPEEGDSNDVAPAPSANDSEATSIARLFPQAYLPPFSVHREAESTAESQSEGDSTAWELVRRAADALTRLQRRQWGCPTGTTSCDSIGYPYSCCEDGETCYVVTDTGLGPVGCCPSGSTCGGAVSSCASDSTACPSSLGGGCCIAGFVCEGVGCVKSTSTGTATATATGTSTSTTTSTTVATTAQPTTVVVTVVVTETPGGGVTTRTTTITSTPSASTTTKTTATTTTSGNGVAPVKPTLTTTASGLPAGYCPTGYYACVASAGGGCCQTGRDCQTTSCPAAAASSTIVNSHGVTVVVPATAAAAATTSSATCAAGWFLCGASAGPVAGCCPSGYSCGTASCTLVSASSTGEVQKALPGSSGARRTMAATSWWLPLAAAPAVYLLWG